MFQDLALTNELTQLIGEPPDKRLLRLAARAKRYWRREDFAQVQLPDVLLHPDDRTQARPALRECLLRKAKELNQKYFYQWEWRESRHQPAPIVLAITTEAPHIWPLPSPRYAFAHDATKNIHALLMRHSIDHATVRFLHQTVDIHLNCATWWDRLLWRPMAINASHDDVHICSVEPLADIEGRFAKDAITIRSTGGWNIPVSTSRFSVRERIADALAGDCFIGPREEWDAVLACILAYVAFRETWIGTDETSGD